MQFVRNLLIEQRRRTIGALMGHIEERVYPRLPAAERKDLRDKVLATVNAYHDICLDILKSSVSDGTVVNEEAVRMLTEMHAAMTARSSRRV